MTEAADKKLLLLALEELIHPAPIPAKQAARFMAKTLAFAVRKVYEQAKIDPKIDPIKVFAVAIDRRTERGKVK